MAERLISADSHVKVSHQDVKRHLATKYHPAYDDALVRFGQHMAQTQGAAIANAMSLEQRTYPSAGRPGYADAVERLRDMDGDGVDVEVLYSEVSAFRYLAFLKEGWRDALRAFNDVLLEFAAVDPKRLVVSYQIPVDDIDIAVAEVERVAAAGGKSLQLPVNPAELGHPDYYHERYDPLWAAIQDADLPICLHIGLNTMLDDVARRDPTPHKGVLVPVTGLMTAESYGMWILGGVLEKFPRLKLVFVEPGMGWVPWYLEIVDDMATRQKYDFPAITELPSVYFHRNIHVTFIDEPIAVQSLRHHIGIENMLWSTDYPHPVSSWPNSRAIVDSQFTGVPPHERELITSGNASRVWNL